jgi:hypothetical protein
VVYSQITCSLLASTVLADRAITPEDVSFGERYSSADGTSAGVIVKDDDFRRQQGKIQRTDYLVVIFILT